MNITTTQKKVTAMFDMMSRVNSIATLQTNNNLLLSFLLKGVETLIQSSDVATNNSNDKVSCNNYYSFIDKCISINSKLYNSFIRCIYQYIYHTVKLFCFIGRSEKYNTLYGKYSLLGSVLVSNRPDNFGKQNRGVTNNV